MFKCKYCGREFSTGRKLGGHSINCPNHPNKSYYDACHKQAGLTLSNNIKSGITKAAFAGRKLSNEHKEKLSLARAKTLEKECLDKPYAHIKWHKVKNIKNEEFSVRGMWEVNVAKRLNELNLYWIKSKPIKYIKDYTHNYTPDFYIPSLNAYIEVKGRYTDDDKEKMTLVHQQHKDITIYFIHSHIYEQFIHGKIELIDDMLLKNYV